MCGGACVHLHLLYMPAHCAGSGPYGNFCKVVHGVYVCHVYIYIYIYLAPTCTQNSTQLCYVPLLATLQC